jgi:hypothetical protein
MLHSHSEFLGEMLQQNCCVNIDGKKSKGIELDAFVEAEIVQPLKTYVSGIILLYIIIFKFTSWICNTNYLFAERGCNHDRKVCPTNGCEDSSCFIIHA